jgi:hypothetical protein
MPPKKTSNDTQPQTERRTIKLDTFDILKECQDEDGNWVSPLGIFYGFSAC